MKPPGGSPRREERGSATLLVVASASVLLFVALALVVVGGVVTSHRRAQAAADLAALAGATAAGRGRDACAAARRVADANGGRLVDCDAAGGEVVVRVEVTGPEGVRRRLDVVARSRAGPPP